MATLNIIPETKQSPSAMRGLINYCIQEKKTFDINSGRKLITGVNCIPQNAYTEFMVTKAVYHQERGVNFYHFSQSFSPDEKIFFPFWIIKQTAANKRDFLYSSFSLLIAISR